MPGPADDGLDQSHRMVRLLLDGLRFGAAQAGLTVALTRPFPLDNPRR